MLVNYGKTNNDFDLSEMIYFYNYFEELTVKNSIFLNGQNYTKKIPAIVSGDDIANQFELPVFACCLFFFKFLLVVVVVL